MAKLKTNFNKSKLEGGKVYSNYKELCEDLEIKYTTGSSKIAQFKDLACVCEYEQEGHKIKIIEVFHEEKDREKRKGNNNRDIYGELVQLAILSYLSKIPDKSTVISKTNLLQKVGLTNRNYVTLKSFPQKLANYIGYNVIYIYDFYKINDSKLKQITSRALKTLEDKRLIFHHSVIKLKKINSSTQIIASTNEVYYILDLEKSLLNKYNYRSMSSVRNSKKWKEFKTELDALLMEEMGVEYYYHAYDITINNKYINDEIKNLEEDIIKVLTNDIKYQDLLNEVNVKIKTNSLIDAKKRNCNLELYGTNKEFRLTEDYIEAFEKLIDILIDINKPNLIADVLSNSNGRVELIKLNLDEILPF